MSHLDAVELMVKPTTWVVGFVFGVDMLDKVTKGCDKGTGIAV